MTVFPAAASSRPSAPAASVNSPSHRRLEAQKTQTLSMLMARLLACTLRSVRRTPSLNAYAFLAFPLTILLVFTLIPTVIGLGLSLFSWAGGGPARYVG